MCSKALDDHMRFFDGIMKISAGKYSKFGVYFRMEGMSLFATHTAGITCSCSNGPSNGLGSEQMRSSKNGIKILSNRRPILRSRLLGFQEIN